MNAPVRLNRCRRFPDDKVAVLGLVTTKTPRRETPEGLTARIKEASQFVAARTACLEPTVWFCYFGPWQSHYGRRSET